MNNQRLLVMACSATKTRQVDGFPVPPLNYYDGPVWRTFRKWHSDNREEMESGALSVYALSAYYGLVHVTRPIEPYDCKMTNAEAARLISYGDSTGTVGANAYLELERLLCDWETPNVLFVGGSLYASVFAAWMAQAQPDIFWRATCDGARGIGDMLGELRLWLNAPEVARSAVPIDFRRPATDHLSDLGRLL